jgi:putative transcriptional regulator
MTLDSFGPAGSERAVALNVHADISRLVRELRERTGLTQEKFAAKLGVTLPTVNRWENGKAKPSPLALKQVEGLLGGMGDQGRDLLRKYFAQGEE